LWKDCGVKPLNNTQTLNGLQLTSAKVIRLLSILSVMSCHVMAAILGLIEPEIAPFDPPTLKTLL